MSQTASSAPEAGENQPPPPSDGTNSAPPDVEPRSYTPLAERIPKTATVVDVVKSDLEVKNMLELTAFFADKESQALLFDIEFWEGVAKTLVNAILECSASSHKVVRKMTLKFRGKKNDILAYIGAYDLYGEGATIPPDQRLEASRLMQLIGCHFLSEFPKLIKSCWGEEVRSIPEQIQEEVEKACALAVDELFGEDVRLSEHAYYVVGFLCHSGMRERKRRSDKSDVGKCIEAACSHYLSTGDSELAALKEKLPTGLVDRRIAMGGLKYPDEQFYGLFGRVELSYSKVVTPDNFMARGGLLLAEIREALVENETLVHRFTQLLGPRHAFSAETIQDAFAYFVKVFCNLRAKDIALKYNSNLNGSNTVGLRQTLAGGINLGKKKRGRGKQSSGASTYQQMKVKELKQLCRERKLAVGGIKKVLVARLEASDAEGQQDSDEECMQDDLDADPVHEMSDDEDIISDTEMEKDDDSGHSDMLAALSEADSEREDDFTEKVSDRDIIANNVENDM